MTTTFSELTDAQLLTCFTYALSYHWLFDILQDAPLDDDERAALAVLSCALEEAIVRHDDEFWQMFGWRKGETSPLFNGRIEWRDKGENQ